MKQLVNPNLGQTSLAGWCLYFARVAFGAPAVEASAWSGWANTKYKHGEALPNVCVPVWFQHFGSYGTPATWANWGHVAIWVPGRGLLSSPITFNGPGQQWFSSIQELENTINRILPKSNTRYVGWSEDISGVRVAKEDEVAIIENADNWRARANKSFLLIRGRGMGDGEMNPWVGQDFLHLIEALEDDAEADKWYSDGVLGRRVRTENWEGQLSNLNSQVTDLQTRLGATASENDALKQEIERLKTEQPEVEEPSEPQKSQKTLWDSLVELFNKLFKKEQ